MSIICLEYKACSIGYFMDEMKDYELEIIMDNLNYCVRNDWELARQQMWASLQAFSTKKIKPTDIMNFPWEKKGKKQIKKTTLDDITEDVQKRMKDNAEKTKQMLMSIGAL